LFDQDIVIPAFCEIVKRKFYQDNGVADWCLAMTKQAPMARLNVPFGHEPDAVLLVRAAWLYYMCGLTQGETAGRLGIHRARVVRLLSEARDRGVVSISINHEAIREFEVEAAIAARFQLDFCLATPPLGVEIVMSDRALLEAQAVIARRAVGAAGARLLAAQLASAEASTIGVSWGRTVEQLALHLNGVRAPRARFVSLMGSLTKNSASNPFEVVQALAARTGGSGYFVPVPFIADSAADRNVLMSQRTVADALRFARSADLYLISVGELTERSVLRQQQMITSAELQSVRAAGAVGDTLGKLFNRDGLLVEHELNDRTLGFDLDDLRGRNVVLLGAGLEKVHAIEALLRSGIVRGLIVDGDTAARLAGATPAPAHLNGAVPGRA
jgi:DNA-binding transcriptional regulator LsrR (DeoR family)